ncbi:MAG: bifunctional DNA primase/polymerase [bacterium]|nr:bifunctional DNA primase/polymerase [bacterium]
MDIVTEALYYAEALEWQVIPLHGLNKDGTCTCHKGANCKTPGKHPRNKGWQHQASMDPQQIRDWFTKKWPISNLGVRLGPASGIIDIEYDGEEGKATAAKLLANVKTPTYRSSRSVHHLLAFPKGLDIAKAVVKFRGLEIRFGTGDKGAQSVFPPSRHASGVVYEWIQDPRSVGIAEPPEWLREAVEGDQADDKQSAKLDSLEFVMGSSETLETHPGAVEGSRHDTALELVGRWLGTHGAKAALLDAAIDWAARCSPPYPQGEILGIVQRLTDKHQEKVFEGTTGRESVNTSGNTTITRSLIVKSYAEIKSEAVEWLWQDRIPRGKYVIFAGKPGVGKTFCAMYTAAQVSTGGTFPDGAKAPLGDVLIISSEDGAGDTLKPRLEAAGADMSRIFHLYGVEVAKGDDFLDLSTHLPQLEQFFEEHPELSLMILDPLTAFLGDKIDSHKEGAVRRVLGPVCELLERRKVAMLGIGHCNKAAQAKAIDKVVGSIGFVAAARVAWMFAKDPDNEQQVLMLPIKNNLSQRQSGLCYSIIDNRCCWSDGEVFVSADDIDDTENVTPRDEAKRWLEDKLKDGGYAAASIWKEAKADGIAEKTLKRAKKDLGIVSDKVGDAWVWQMPDAEPQPNLDFEAWNGQASQGEWIVE